MILGKYHKHKLLAVRCFDIGCIMPRLARPTGFGPKSNSFQLSIDHRFTGEAVD
jgi:hypothetical protein